MKRLCKKFRLGETVKVKNPNLNGIFTIIGQDENGNYTLWDGTQQYPNISHYDIIDSDEFTIGSKVKFKNDPNNEVFTITDLLGNDKYFIENTNNAYTAIDGDALESV